MSFSLLESVSVHSLHFLRWWFSFLSHTWTHAAVTKPSWLKLEVCCAVLLVPVSSWWAAVQGLVEWCRNKLFRRCGYCSLLAEREVEYYWLHCLKSESRIWKWVRSQLIRFLPVLEQAVLFLPNIGKICLIGAKGWFVQVLLQKLKIKHPKGQKLNTDLVLMAPPLPWMHLSSDLLLQRSFWETTTKQ